METIHLAQPQDISAIVDLFQSGFDRHLLNYTILGGFGVKAFLRQRLKTQQSLFVVMSEASQIVGAAEFRHDNTSLFLNHIFVHPSKQGHGIGSRLLGEGIKIVRSEQQTSIRLDVFQHNQEAWRWYARLGFTSETENVWFELALRSHPDKVASGWYVSGLSEADQEHERYGFSQFNVHIGYTQYTVGRLGEKFFRVADIAAAEDHALLNALYHTDANRSLLAIGKPGFGTLLGKPIATSTRLWASVDAVLAALSSRNTTN